MGALIVHKQNDGLTPATCSRENLESNIKQIIRRKDITKLKRSWRVFEAKITTKTTEN